MSRATDDITTAAKLLQAAVLFIPEGEVQSEVAHLARRCEKIIENVVNVEADDPFGIGALRPFELKLGLEVWYYPVLPGQRDQRTPAVISSEPWQLGTGLWLVKLQGRSGGFATTHLAPR